mgnify:CR=1 FL=1
MRIIGIVAVMLILVSVGSGYWWDTEKILQGQQMLKTGAPWFSDDAAMYFGDDKDASIGFVSASGTLDVSGAMKMPTMAVGVNASTTISTVLTSASTKTVYDMNAAGANVTLTLPDAATVPGRMYFISVSGNPGANYARITATGGDDINANNYLVSTDQWSTAVIVASNGAYRALTSGTWAAHA